MKLPIVNKGITLQEIPDEIAVFFEVGNCIRKCKGCHSASIMCRSLHKSLWTPVEDMIKYAKMQKKKGATAIVLMGGTTNKDVTLEMLHKAIYELSHVLPVGVYSGADNNSIANKSLADNYHVRWLKTGAYSEAMGGLGSPTTNQKFYARGDDLEMYDITFRFWEGNRSV